MKPYKYIDWDSIPLFMTVAEAGQLLRTEEHTVQKYLKAEAFTFRVLTLYSAFVSW